ncbi:MAG: hypothetical protein HBSAPP02_28710 [Phycisphaerae bacterium]|nr:MAG: hypothetical protein HBSAPP02_28710 [Phycisphaerae bacterium]
MPHNRKTFGQILRQKRIDKGLSLRKFAELVGVSPTYQSQVEQDKVESPPTVERLTRMADVLGEDRDQFISLAGRVADDLPPIIQSRPDELPKLLRTTKGLAPEQLRELIAQAKKMKDKEK